MAITSKGYAGTIDYADWAAITAHMGGTYSVFGDAGTLDATPGPGDREVVIAPGRAGGAGIVDVLDAPVTVAGAVVGSGSRWDLIVLRRDWTGAATTVEIKTGGTITGRAIGPGALDEQPLWLARFAAGKTAVQELVDLRVWRGDSGLVANDVQVRSYMNRIGTSIRIGSTQWIRTLVGTTPTWLDLATWAQVTGKPATFPPSAHDHARLLSGANHLTIGQDSSGARLHTPKALVYDRWYNPTTMSGRRFMVVTEAGTIGSVEHIPVFSFDLGSVTVGANTSRVFDVTLPYGASASDFTVAVGLSTRSFTYGFSRGGNTVSVRVYNETSSPVTGTVNVTLTRTWEGTSVPPATT